MELFDIVKTIFKSDKDWDKVSRNDKTKNFFMLNRIMSIQFPMQAHQFNHTKISPRPVADWWHNTLSRHYTKMPSWIFTKTKKSQQKKISTTPVEADPEVEKFIREKFRASNRELADLKKFFPEKYQEWTNSIADQINVSNK
jgi:hypothetical protein